MKKTFFILSFILISFLSFSQKQRTTSTFDADTTTRPKTGFYGIGVRSNNVYFVPQSGNNIRLANYSLFTGLTTNYLTTWNGSKLVNSVITDDGTNAIINSVNNVDFRLQRAGVNFVQIQQNAGGGFLAIFDPSSQRNVAFRAYGNTELNVFSGNVGIGTASPLSKLQIGVLPNASGAMSGTIATYAGSLGTTLGNSLKVASFGFAASNSTALGVTAYRTANGSFFGTTAIGLGFDVDNSSYSVDNGMWFNATGQVGVGVVTPEASAKLHISSTTQGVLITRGTTTQINAISSPANGLMVYNTTLNKLCVYENGSWKQVTTTTM